MKLHRISPGSSEMRAPWQCRHAVEDLLMGYQASPWIPPAADCLQECLAHPVLQLLALASEVSCPLHSWQQAA